MFVVNGATYAVTAPIWGYMCDKKLVPPIAATTIGSLFILTAFLFIGPAPFIPLDLSINLCIGMLVLHGIGFAAQLVAGFSSAHKQAILNGFDDNLKTYALVSGLWTSTFALGAFIGPSLAGILMHHFGFPKASLLVVFSQLSVLLAFSTYIFSLYYKRKRCTHLHKLTSGKPPLAFLISRFVL